MGLIAAALQFSHQQIPVIALDLNMAVFDRSPRAAQFLELFSKGLEFIVMQGKTADHGHAFAFSALGFSEETDIPVALDSL